MNKGERKKTRQWRRLLPVLLAVTVFAVLSTRARAEEAAPQVLDEVVVTATRTENKVMETSSNIAVIKAEDLENMDAKNVAEALKKLPGVYYSNASGLEPKISLRGTHIGMSGGALVLLNGIPVNLGKFGYTDFESLPIENIERVEVVKGPMSALYGGDSARGVINIVTKRGNKPYQGKVSATLGTYNDQRYSALAYGVFGDFDYNINPKKREQDGYRRHTSIHNEYINGEFGYTLGDDARISFYYNIGDIDRDLAKRLTEKQLEEDRRMDPDYSSTENTDVVTGFNLEVSKALYDFRTTLYYKYRDKDYKNYMLATSTPYKEELDEDVYGIRSILSWKQPLRGRRNTLSIGFDCDYDDSDLDKWKAAEKVPGAAYVIHDPKKSGSFTRLEIGLFIQDELRLTDKLSLTAGLRYDYFEFDNDADYDFSQEGKYDYDEKPDYDNWNPRFSVNYRVLDNLSLYAGYSKAYRAPNIYDYYASGDYAARNGYTLKPETFTQWETGVRYFFGDWLSADLCYFHLVIDDMLQAVYDADGHYGGKQNVGEVRLEGVELTLSGALGKRVNYRISYSYFDSRYKDDLYAKISRYEVVNVKGNSLTKTPDNKVSVDLDVKAGEIAGIQFLWHGNFYWQDEYEMDSANTDQYKDYALVNTKLRAVKGPFEAFFAVSNLFDEEYCGYAYRSSDKNYYYPAAGRTYAAGLAFKF